MFFEKKIKKVLYLGSEYTLNIIEAKGNLVLLDKEVLNLHTHSPKNKKTIEEIIYKWYLIEAQPFFEARLDSCFNIFNEGKGFNKPALKIKRLKRRWGSLHYKQLMTLNLELIRMDKECIDYVIMHELCHLIHSNHQKDFHLLLSSYYPNSKQIRSRLKVIPSAFF